MTDTDTQGQTPEPMASAALARLGRPSPAQRAAGWVTWHAGELAAVGLPGVLAATVSPWAWALVGLAGGVWGYHELRQAQQRRALLGEQDDDSAQHQDHVEDQGENESREERRHA